VQEICTLRAMRRALETESRKLLTGHEGGNAGNSQGSSYGFTRQRSTLPTLKRCVLGRVSNICGAQFSTATVSPIAVMRSYLER
jgi:hypothetical protein